MQTKMVIRKDEVTDILLKIKSQNESPTETDQNKLDSMETMF